MKTKLVIFIVGLFLTLSGFGQIWEQKGTDIDGLAADDFCGRASDINADGNIVVVSSTQPSSSTGEVRIFQWDGDDWTQLGTSIVGDADVYAYGSNVAITNDGLTVAIYHSGPSYPTGAVEVYDYDEVSGSWTQRGDDLLGDASFDKFGTGIDISAGGDTLAIGASQTAAAPGYARVFEWTGSDWAQIGTDIVGDEVGDSFGGQVALSYNGETVVIGARSNDTDASDAGQVKVFTLEAGDWIQMGVDIYGEVASSMFGQSVAISASGSTIASGAQLLGLDGSTGGHVRVFDWDTDHWAQRGGTVYAEADGDIFGFALDLSANGNRFAAGAIHNGGPGNYRGHVRVHTWNGTEWEKTGGDVDGESLNDFSGEAVSISSDGLVFTSGSFFNDGAGSNAGHLRVFEFPATAATISVENCESYTVPSGDETYTTVGTYTVMDTITNYFWNDSIITINLTIHDLPTVEANVVDDLTEICLEDEITFFGSGATSYIWDVIGVTDGALYEPTTTGTTTYTVTGTDDNGCSNTASIDILVNELPTVTASVDDAEICMGDEVTFTGGGTADTYDWDEGVTDGELYAPGATGTTTYTVTGTNTTTGCINTATVDVLVHELPAVTANVDDLEICLGDQVTFTGGGTDTYTWDMGVTNDDPFTPPTAGTATYTVTGTNTATGCINTATIDVLVHELPAVTANVDNLEICLGEAVTFTGSGADTYTWDMGVTNDDPFTPPTAGTATYTVTGTDGNGCVNTASVDVLVFGLPTVEANVVDDLTEICLEDEITLFGSGATSYIWDVMGVVDGEIYEPTITGTTTYNVTGTDDNGCSNTASIDILVNELPTVTANVDATEICVGDQVTFTGGGADTYTWDEGVIDGELYEPVAAGTTTYTVSGTDGNGCVNTASVDVLVFALPIVTANADPSQVCIGQELTLTGGGATTYVWDNDVEDGIAFEPIMGTTTYTVTGTDDNGCINTASIDVTVYDLPTVIANANTNELCLGNEVTFTGSGAETYTWDNGVMDNTPYLPTLIGTETYTVIGTDENGCQSSASIDVTVLELPEVIASADTSIYPGESTLIEASSVSNGTYLWSPEQDLACPTCNETVASPLSTRIYTITFTDENGCQATDQVVITLLDLIVETEIGISPNGDGLNETLDFKGLLAYPNSSIQIFNRWGVEVYTAENGYQNDWGGTDQNTGDLLPNNSTCFFVLDLGEEGVEPVKGYVYISY